MELHFACVFIRESESVYHLSADRLTEKKNSLSIIIYYRFEKRVIMMRFDIFWADPVSATPHKIDFFPPHFRLWWSPLRETTISFGAVQPKTEFCTHIEKVADSSWSLIVIKSLSLLVIDHRWLLFKFRRDCITVCKKRSSADKHGSLQQKSPKYPSKSA